MAAFACGPIEFTDANGKHVSVPVSALKFTAGRLAVDPTIWKGETPPFLSALLSNLVTQGIVLQAPAPARQPAMVFRAADVGASGNNITVGISVAADPDPNKAKISVTVTETDVYPGLTMATLESVVGSDTMAGAQPGLAHVVHSSLGPAPAKLPDAQSRAFPSAAVGTKSTVKIKAGAAVAFELEAKKAGPDAKFTNAAISAVSASAKTFTLTLTWTVAVKNSTLATLQDDLKDVGYEVNVIPPASGVFSVPAATAAGAPLALTGGSASASASATGYVS